MSPGNYRFYLGARREFFPSYVFMIICRLIPSPFFFFIAIITVFNYFIFSSYLSVPSHRCSAFCCFNSLYRYFVYYFLAVPPSRLLSTFLLFHSFFPLFLCNLFIIFVFSFSLFFFLAFPMTNLFFSSPLFSFSQHYFSIFSLFPLIPFPFIFQLLQ